MFFPYYIQISEGMNRFLRCLIALAFPRISRGEKINATWPLSSDTCYYFQPRESFSMVWHNNFDKGSKINKISNFELLLKLSHFTHLSADGIVVAVCTRLTITNQFPSLIKLIQIYTLINFPPFPSLLQIGPECYFLSYSFRMTHVFFFLVCIWPPYSPSANN